MFWSSADRRSAAALDRAILARAADVLHRAYPHATLPLAASADLVEQVLRLVHGLLPAWSIRLTGEATGPDGHWHCSLRENRDSDEDEMIGLGAGATVGLALVAALLRVALDRAAR